MKALKEFEEDRARRGSNEEEEETEETIWKKENGKGQQKVWSLRDSGDDFAMFSFKIGTSIVQKQELSFKAGGNLAIFFRALFQQQKKNLSLSVCLSVRRTTRSTTNERTN